MGTPCAQCGKDLGEDLLRGARVCSVCGAPIPAPTAAQTMIGFTSPLAPAARPAQPERTQPMPATPQAPAPAPAPAPGPAAPPAPAPAKPAPMAQTMLGFAAPDLRPAAPAPAPSGTAPQPVAPQPVAPQPGAPQPVALAPQAAPAPLPAGARTMLGIAAPSLGAPAQPPAQPQPQPPAAAKLGSGTLLGVAVPGIAPTHSQPGAPPPQAAPAKPAFGGTMLLDQAPPIVPAPAPFMPETAPAAPVVVGRRGVPLAAVAIVASLLVLGGGAALLYFSRGSVPMTATAKVSADGKEQLHLECESCPDGTKASWHGASASFAKHAADLDLPAPLAIGDNAFDIALDRPGVGRDETVKLVLPLAYRIRGDLGGLDGTPPVLRVVVEAVRGTTVTVDGKPVTLDAGGKATLSYDVTRDTSGPADEARTISRKIPYDVIGKDKKKSHGEVAIRVAVLPLHIDAPGTSLVTDRARVWVSGKTAKGATVTADGTDVRVGADGSFEGQVDIHAGQQQIVLRAAPGKDAAGKLAARTASVSVERVASLDAEAKKLDEAHPLGGDALVSDPAGSAGRAAAVRGTVVESRTDHHRTSLLLDDKRDCKAVPCLVRVAGGADLDAHAGDSVAAWGAVGKPITTPDGKTLPVIEATLARSEGKKR